MGDVVLVREALAFHEVDAELLLHRDGEAMLRYIEAVDAGEAACPDLVLLDLNLPRRNGAALLERIRRSPVCGTVPVVIVTSSGAARDHEEATRLGASRYFRKPSDYDEFLQLGAIVRQMIETPPDSVQ